jgi:hypothetical protein
MLLLTSRAHQYYGRLMAGWLVATAVCVPLVARPSPSRRTTGRPDRVCHRRMRPRGKCQSFSDSPFPLDSNNTSHHQGEVGGRRSPSCCRTRKLAAYFSNVGVQEETKRRRIRKLLTALDTTVVHASLTSQYYTDTYGST